MRPVFLIYKKGFGYGTLIFFLCIILSNNLLYSLNQTDLIKFDSPVNVSNNPKWIQTGPAIAVDKKNVVHIIWQQLYASKKSPDGVVSDIYYTNNKDGTFMKAIKLPVQEKWYSRCPSITVDPKGNAHIVFRRSSDQTFILSEDDIYYVHSTGGTLSKPLLLIDGKFGFLKSTEVSMPHNALIRADSKGSLHLFFQAFEFGNKFTIDDLILYMKNDNGSWSNPRIAGRGEFITVYSIDVDCMGYAHLIYNSHGKLYYTHNINTEFEKPVRASSKKHDVAYPPDLAIDSLGYADIFYTNNKRDDFKTFTPLGKGSSNYIPEISVDDYDFVHIVYKQTPFDGGRLVYANNFSGEFKSSNCGEMGDYWYIGSRYFSLGKTRYAHFVFYDWRGAALYSDADIFYLKGIYTRPKVPSAPRQLRAILLNNTSVKITWLDKSKKEDGYEIQRKDGENGQWEKIAAAKKNRKYYADRRLKAKTQYMYRVRAFDDVGYSRYSNKAKIRTK